MVSLCNRPAADSGAGRNRIDSARTEELSPCAIQIPVVTVDVAHVDPRARDVAKSHAGLMQKLLGENEHAERLFVGSFTRSAQRGGVEPNLVADVDPEAVRTSALGTGAGGSCLDQFKPRR